MGTNYYTLPTCKNACEHCTEGVRHIGKSTGGWTFGFRGYPDIRSRKDWEQVLASQPHVVDEYGQHLRTEDFWKIVEGSRKPFGPEGMDPITRARKTFGGVPSMAAPDPEGWDFTFEEFS